MTVSVLLPYRDAGPTVIRAIESVLAEDVVDEVVAMTARGTAGFPA